MFQEFGPDTTGDEFAEEFDDELVEDDHQFGGLFFAEEEDEILDGVLPDRLKQKWGQFQQLSFALDIARHSFVIHSSGHLSGDVDELFVVLFFEKREGRELGDRVQVPDIGRRIQGVCVRFVGIGQPGLEIDVEAVVAGGGAGEREDADGGELLIREMRLQ